MDTFSQTKHEDTTILYKGKIHEVYERLIKNVLLRYVMKQYEEKSNFQIIDLMLLSKNVYNDNRINSPNPE